MNGWISFIPLTQGKWAIIDTTDLERVSQHKWCYSQGYASRAWHIKGKGYCQHMHRYIMDAPKGTILDHKNLNTLDNCRSNLRYCNKAQNTMNRLVRRDSISGFKGIHFWKERDKYVVHICANRKPKTVGYFKTLPEAIIAYNEAAIKYHGEFARLNVIPVDAPKKK